MISDTLKEKIEKLDPILSTMDVADFFLVHYLTVYRMIRRGELPAYKDDEEHWCILRSDLKKYCSRMSNL